MPAARRALPFAIALLGAISAACGSSTTTSTAPSTIDRCSLTARATNASMPASGGAGRIDVTTQRECSWTASSEASWLTLNGTSSGQGDGSVAYQAAPNGEPVARRAAIVLNNQRTEISQAPGECVIRLGSASAEFSPAGGKGTVRIEASSQLCTWTASAEADWISLTSPANGTGPGSIEFEIGATSGPPRTGTIRVADQRFSVTQSQGCTYTISPVHTTVLAAGGSGTVDVATARGCPWTAVSNASWITITSGSTGDGPGEVTFAAAALDGPARAGALVIAGQTFRLDQTAGCSYQVAPLAHAVGASGGTVTVNVQTSAACPWTASSAVPWITVIGTASGNGSGSVALSVAATTGGVRTGTATIAGQTVTVNQAQACSYSIQPESVSVPAAGESVTVNVTAGSGCAWTAASNVPWIFVTGGASGSGNGTVRLGVAAATGAARTGTVTIAGKTFTVKQGQGCTATLNPASTAVEASGGTRTFDVRTAGGCGWTAASGVPWITIASGGSGSGNGAVRIDIAANTGAPRTGTVTAAGEVFAVEQASGCSIAITPSNQSVPAAGGNGKIDVAADAGCVWTAVADQPWITITDGASGSGGGAVVYSVAANPGPRRSGSINVGGQTFTITQDGACSFAIDPEQHAAAAPGGSVSVGVTTSSGCAWTAASSSPWITLSDGASGAGSGTVSLDIEANPGPARTGTATIAGVTFTVNQASGCTYELSPPSRSADEDGGRDSFNVTTSSPECSWTAVSTVPWITIRDEASGSGNGRVNYRVDRNPAEENRQGTIVVEGEVFTVNQQGDN